MRISQIKNACRASRRKTVTAGVGEVSLVPARFYHISTHATSSYFIQTLAPRAMLAGRPGRSFDISSVVSGRFDRSSITASNSSRRDGSYSVATQLYVYELERQWRTQGRRTSRTLPAKRRRHPTSHRAGCNSCAPGREFALGEVVLQRAMSADAGRAMRAMPTFIIRHSPHVFSWHTSCGHQADPWRCAQPHSSEQRGTWLANQWPIKRWQNCDEAHSSA